MVKSTREYWKPELQNFSIRVGEQTLWSNPRFFRHRLDPRPVCAVLASSAFSILFGILYSHRQQSLFGSSLSSADRLTADFTISSDFGHRRFGLRSSGFVSSGSSACHCFVSSGFSSLFGRQRLLLLYLFRLRAPLFSLPLTATSPASMFPSAMHADACPRA